MSSSLPSLFLFIFCLFNTVQAADYFVNPPEAGPAAVYAKNLELQQGTTQDIRWVTTIQSYNITLWQQNLSKGAAQQGPIIFAKAKGDPEPSHFSWVVQTYSFDLKKSPVFFLGVNFPDKPFFNSHYFNITKSSTATSSGSTTTPTSSPTTSPDTAPRSPNTLPIALGVSIPVVLIAIALAFFLFRRRQKKRYSDTNIPLQPPFQEEPQYMYRSQHSSIVDGGYDGIPSELGGKPRAEERRVVSELPERGRTVIGSGAVELPGT